MAAFATVSAVLVAVVVVNDDYCDEFRCIGPENERTPDLRPGVVIVSKGGLEPPRDFSH
jgi:hypothetical protein